ncbi:MAG: bifunctional nuclease family protein [Spirochaetales bacterium]|nr:bifunctional nuclease family protein [Spirochaetales bacterium]
MNKQLAEMEVKGIALDKETELPIVLLQTKNSNHILPLPIGPFEASAIIIEIEGVHPPRPLTHDLLSEFFRRHKFRFNRLEIYDIIDDNIMARIYYKKGLKSHKMEVRPSDGIALAIREEAPVYVHSHVLNNSGDEQWLVKNNTGSIPEIIFLSNPGSGTPLM